MVYRTLCGDDVSLLGFGFLRIPQKDGLIDYIQLQPMVDYAISNGVNYFETAFNYLKGDSEIALGRVLVKHERSKVYISTKMNMHKLYSKDIMKSIFDTQLQRLGTDYIDNYLFHYVSRTNWDNFKKSGLYNFLLEMKQAGKVRHIGFSFHDTPEFLNEVVSTYDWDFAQLQINYLDWSVQRAKEQYQICADKGLPIIVMEPIRGGELANLPQSVKDELPEHKSSVISNASLALRWAASLPQVSVVLSGMSNIGHISDNIETFQSFRPVQSEEQNNINKAVKVYLSLGMIPCTSCGYCVSVCPKEIDIPTILSAANYYFRTKDKKVFNSRQYHISEERRAEYCIECNKCLPYCPQRVDIPGELKNIAKMTLTFKKRLRKLATRILPRSIYLSIYDFIRRNT